MCGAGKARLAVQATTKAQGEYGSGAFKNEPWSLQSYEKRVYAVREFYKATLRGEMADNPADDDRVKGMLASIVRVVGRKKRHVPQVGHVTHSNPKHIIWCSRAVVGRAVCG